MSEGFKMKIDVNTSSEEVKQKTKEALQSLCSVKNNQTDNGEVLHELFDVARTHRIKNSKPNFSERDFITLLLTKFVDNGITKIDTVELKGLLAEYYSIEKYTCLFEDIALKEQIEGSIVELDNALLFAYQTKMLSNPIQGTDTRIIWRKEIDGLYSDEYVALINSLVTDIKEKHIKSEISHPISLSDHDVIQKVIELQEIILNKKQKVLSIEKIIDFLNSAMNYVKFQIWLSECEFNGTKLTINDKLREFFNVTSVEEILNIYDIECGYDNSIISESEQGPVKKIVPNNTK